MILTMNDFRTVDRGTVAFLADLDEVVLRRDVDHTAADRRRL